MADQRTDLPPKVGHIFTLTEIIMEVDPENNMGAIDLAEAILSHPASRWTPSPEADGQVAKLVNHARNSNTQAVALAVALEQLADAADQYGPAGGADGKALSEAVKRARKTLNRAAELDGTQPTSGGDYDHD